MSGANERLFLLDHPHLRITAGNPAYPVNKKDRE